jgi:hypothetical protein
MLMTRDEIVASVMSKDPRATLETANRVADDMIGAGRKLRVFGPVVEVPSMPGQPADHYEGE